MRSLIRLLDAVMLFCFPTAEQNWENRGLVLLMLVAVVVLAKVYAP